MNRYYQMMTDSHDAVNRNRLAKMEYDNSLRQQQFDNQLAGQERQKKVMEGLKKEAAQVLMWADTPEKLQQAQMHYKQNKPAMYRAFGGDATFARLYNGDYNQNRGMLLAELGSYGDYQKQQARSNKLGNFYTGADGKRYGVNAMNEAVPVAGPPVKEQPGVSVTNVLPKPAADSLAKQVGPIVQASRQQTSGAIDMFRQSQEILNTLEDGDVTVGLGATLRHAADQVASMLGFAGADRVVRTRQLIRSLAQMSVEARKKLAGQGTVTDSEARAVQKANSGEIDELTVEELKLLAVRNMKDAQIMANQHKQYLDQLGDDPVRPFYELSGMEPLLNYKPQDVMREPTSEPTEENFAYTAAIKGISVEEAKRLYQERKNAR